MYIVVPALILLLMIGALADIITSDQWRIKHLDKVFWIIIVILLPLAGSILWFTVGRDYGGASDRGSFGDPRRWQKPTPLDTASELAALESEIAASRKEEQIRSLEAQIRARRAKENPPGGKSGR